MRSAQKVRYSAEACSLLIKEGIGGLPALLRLAGRGEGTILPSCFTKNLSGMAVLKTLYCALLSS